MELHSQEARDAKKTQTTLILVRHADTELREDGSKDDDSPLSSRGLEQIPAIIESLRAYRAHHIYASDTRRAAQTANEIGKALALPVQLLPTLREVSFNIGPQSGIKTEEGNRQESVQAFQQRVSESVDGIVSERPEECTVVVAHSGTIRAALNHLLQLPLSAYQVPSIAQGSIVVLVKQSGGTWNSTR
jgi:broad specificity phosphatase PhoE